MKFSPSPNPHSPNNYYLYPHKFRMKKLLLTILLNVLLLLPVVGWGGVHGCNSSEEWTSSETLGLQIRASEVTNPSERGELL